MRLRKIKQRTKTDCMLACIASISPVEIGKLPNIYNVGPSWTKRLDKVLYKYSLKLTWSISPPKNKYCIAGLTHPILEHGHAVVWKNGKVVWDPTTDSSNKIRAGTKIYTIGAFFVLNRIK